MTVCSMAVGYRVQSYAQVTVQRRREEPECCIDEYTFKFSKVINNAHSLYIHLVMCVFQQCILIKQCIIPKTSPPMLHTHSVIYNRCPELKALLNNAFKRIYNHNCTVNPDNKFVKFTYTMDKIFDQVTENQFI